MKVFIYLFDGYADWEIAYLAPEINKSEAHELIYVSKGGREVVSMGGLTVQPQDAVGSVKAEDVGLLVIPGGEAWESGHDPDALRHLVRDLQFLRTPIGAICAATTYIARQGMLDSVAHTSNDPDYLQQLAPEYKGAAQYKSDLSVTDGNIITANGVGAIEFAKEVFIKIQLYDREKTEKWYQLFKHGIW